MAYWTGIWALRQLCRPWQWGGGVQGVGFTEREHGAMNEMSRFSSSITILWNSHKHQFRLSGALC